MRFPYRALTMIQVGAAVWGLLTPQLGFAYEHPLSDQAVRAAYFLGQDADRAAEFLSQYVQGLPVPDHGPHVAQIELRTPYSQVVEASQRRSVGYSAQQAAADYRKRGDAIVVRVEVLFTPTFNGRADDFWRDFAVGLVQKKHMAARRVSGEPIYASEGGRGSSVLIGANIFVEFAVADVESDAVQVEVLPPEGPAARVKFDLNSLS